MPYIVETSARPEDAVLHEFFPKTPMSERRLFNRGEPLTQSQIDNIPRTLLTTEPASGSLPDLLGWNMGPWIVSQRLRDKLDALEPGVHTFVPLSVRRDDGSADYGTYYLILLTQALDAVVLEETKFVDGYGEQAARESAYLLDPTRGPCTLRADAIRGRHFWRGSGGMTFRFFCSDELGAFILDNGLRGWELWPCQVKE